MNSNRRSKRGSQRKNGNNTAVDSLIVASHHSVAKGDYNFAREDLVRRMPSWMLTQTPPKNFRNQITWISEETDSNFVVSASPAFTEFPSAFTLAACPGANRIAQLFDQYCIYSVMARYVPEYGVSGVTPAVPGACGQLITALDFDSNNAILNWAAYQAYGTAVECELVIGKSYERYVKPVCALVMGSSNSTTGSGVAMARQWVNSSYPGAPHWGIRAAAQNNTTGYVINIRVMLTFVIGLRNNF